MIHGAATDDQEMPRKLSSPGFAEELAEELIWFVIMEDANMDTRPSRLTDAQCIDQIDHSSPMRDFHQCLFIVLERELRPGVPVVQPFEGVLQIVLGCEEHGVGDAEPGQLRAEAHEDCRQPGQRYRPG